MFVVEMDLRWSTSTLTHASLDQRTSTRVSTWIAIVEAALSLAKFTLRRAQLLQIICSRHLSFGIAEVLIRPRSLTASNPSTLASLLTERWIVALTGKLDGMSSNGAAK